MLNNKEAPTHDTTNTCSCDLRSVRKGCPVKQLFHANRDMTLNNCATLTEISLIKVRVLPRLSMV